MLNCLEIKNIAIIDNLSVNFNKGLNVLSGETGAGKSIIIDSLNFALGKRADKSLIRYGTDSASVTAFFDISNSENVQKLLEEFDIEQEEELMIKRTMSVDGKNSCLINGQKVTLSMLKQLTSLLVDIYGQNDTTILLNPSSHLDILDDYGSIKIAPLKANQEKLYLEYKDCLKKLKEYGSISELSKNIDLYEYQINEIEEANIQENEEEELIQLRHKMNNSQSILNSLDLSYNALNGEDENIVTLLNTTIHELNKVAQYDNRIDNLIERLDSAKIELKDVSSTILDIAEECDFNPEEYDRIEKRIAKIRLIKKKYGSTLSEIDAYLQEIKEKYDFLVNGEDKVEELEEKKKDLFNKLYKNALELSKNRKTIAKELSKKIETELNELGMKNAKFEISFNQINPIEEYDSIPSNGLDEIEFLFSANAGQPVRELSKIISGGELSRFMLALKNTISNLDNIETMVFDEIDTGISGTIAQVVAEKLYTISKDKQVLAITHLPQLASMADYNYLIEKSTSNSTTHTSLKLLQGDEIIQELARLIGGFKDSNHAIPHAIEMKEHANSLKK